MFTERVQCRKVYSVLWLGNRLQSGYCPELQISPRDLGIIQMSRYYSEVQVSSTLSGIMQNSNVEMQKLKSIKRRSKIGPIFQSVAICLDDISANAEVSDF